MKVFFFYVFYDLIWIYEEDMFKRRGVFGNELLDYVELGWYVNFYFIWVNFF